MKIPTSAYDYLTIPCCNKLAKAWKNYEAFGRNPVGTGPYKFVEWVV